MHGMIRRNIDSRLNVIEMSFLDYTQFFDDLKEFIAELNDLKNTLAESSDRRAIMKSLAKLEDRIIKMDTELLVMDRYVRSVDKSFKELKEIFDF